MGNQGAAFIKKQRKIALVSALLHDIGHGPFSHCFETVTGIHHERWTTRIVKECEEIHSILGRTPGLTEAVLAVMERTGEHGLIEELLFSQIGADKLDYQLRDLHYSGLTEVKPFNLNNLIDALRIHDDRLVIAPDALQEIEQYVVIKRTLFEQRFSHPDVIGKDVLFKLAFRRAKYLFGNGELPHLPEWLVAWFGGMTWTVEQYMQLNDEVMHRLIGIWAEHDDAVLSKLCTRYVSGIEHSIRWYDVTADTVERELDRFTTDMVMQDDKYGCYKAGICTVVSGSIADVLELSPMIKEYAAYSAKRYLYCIDPI